MQITGVNMTGGLMLSRPRTTGAVTALFVSLIAEAEIRVDDTTGISPGMIVTGTGFTSETVTVVAVNSSISLTLSIIAPDPVPAPGTVLTFTNPYTAPPPEFENPTLSIGSAVSTVAQSPFVGGGNSYSFISSTNSVITIPGSTDWAVGTGDFTIEWFGYQTTTSQFQRVFSVGDYPSIKLGVSIESSTFYYWANNSFRYSSAGSTSINTWYHWSVVRQSGTTRVYRDSRLRGSSISDTNNITDSTTNLTIGNTLTPATNAAWVGYITNFRFIKGLAVYSGTSTNSDNFTIPTSALTATASANPYGGSNTAAIGEGYTKLLLVP